MTLLNVAKAEKNCYLFRLFSSLRKRIMNLILNDSVNLISQSVMELSSDAIERCHMTKTCTTIFAGGGGRLPTFSYEIDKSIHPHFKRLLNVFCHKLDHFFATSFSTFISKQTNIENRHKNIEIWKKIEYFMYMLRYALKWTGLHSNTYR